MKIARVLVYVYMATVACVSLYFAVYLVQTIPPGAHKLPCGVAEISPDFSHADRMACRLARGHKL
jgi:hypothetical protein